MRRYNIDHARRLLTPNPGLVKKRWPARGNADGLMRSLGPFPFNHHAWHSAPIDPDFPDDPRYTSTPLHYTQDDDMVALLISGGADVNALGSSGIFELLGWFYTPLFRAAHDGRINSVRRLVDAGADVNYVNPDGTNQALATAAENGHLEVCEYLLEAGAQPDIITACMLGLVEYVRRLLAKDASLSQIRDQHTRSTLDEATLMDSFRVPIPQGPSHDDTAEALIAAGAKADLAHATSLGWLDVVRRLVEEDPEIVLRTCPIEYVLTGGATFETALAAARRRNRTDVMEYLVAHDAQ